MIIELIVAILVVIILFALIAITVSREFAYGIILLCILGIIAGLYERSRES